MHDYQQKCYCSKMIEQHDAAILASPPLLLSMPLFLMVNACLSLSNVKFPERPLWLIRFDFALSPRNPFHSSLSMWRLHSLISLSLSPFYIFPGPSMSPHLYRRQKLFRPTLLMGVCACRGRHQKQLAYRQTQPDFGMG